MSLGVAFQATAAHAAPPCPCTIWSDTITPTVTSAADTAAVEVGVRFRSDTAGFITGLRFYKGPANTGTHVGHLWTNTGAPLATVTFTGETTSGWQQMSLATPVAIAANTTYVASYFAPNGGYAADGGYFAGTSVSNPPLTALADGADGPNGIYLYTASGGFPSNSFNSTNYWVDVVFVFAQAPAITSPSSTSFAVGSAGTFTVTATGSPTPTLSVSGALPAGVTFNPATGVLSGTPAAGSGGIYPLTFTASNGVSPNATQSFTLTVTQAPAITSPSSTSFAVGSAGTFTVTATGSPTPTLSVSGALPAGVTFNPATGVLSGTPAAGTGGTYPLTFTASNGVSPNATQSFTLTVTQATAITLSSSVNPSTLGQTVTFTATVTSGSGTPTGGTVQFKDGAANLGAPVPLTGGTAVLSTSSLSAGTHPITAVYSGAGIFGPATSAVLNQVVNATLTCDAAHTITGKSGPLVLGPGQWCVTSAMVNGLTIQPGAAVSIVNSQLVGPVTSSGATYFRICGSQVSRGLSITGSTGFVVVGGNGTDGCARNDISQGLTLSGNTAGLRLLNNRITTDATVTNNTGSGPLPGDAAPLVGANIITGTLACSGNTPPPVNGGQINTAAAKTGQCSAL